MKSLAAMCCVSAVGLAATEFSAHEAAGSPRLAGKIARDSRTLNVERVGMSHPNQPLRVAALGDSVPAGYGASTSFVNLVGKALADEDDRSLKLDNEAQEGLDSSDVAKELSNPNSATSHAVASADVTLIEVGANDFDDASAQDTSCTPVESAGCYDGEMTTMKQNMQSIVENVKKLEKPGARVVLMGYWNTFKDGKVGQDISSDYVSQGRELARWTNRVFASLAEQNGLYYADVYSPLLVGKDVTSELQDDGDHPNDTGHRIIADAVLQALGSPARA